MVEMSIRTRPARLPIPPLRQEGRLVAGVASGLADALRVDPLVVRAGFVALTAAGGVGLVLYAVAWAVMALAPPAPARSGHLEGLGRRERILGVALVVVGLALLVQSLDLGFDSSVARPVGLVGLGLLIAWHRGRLGAVLDDERSTLIRIVGGLVLVGTGIVGFIALNLDLAQARDTLFLSIAVVAGLALVAAPSIAGLVRDLGAERRQRIRSEERARVAAHLHDSVLQTLALIQRSAGDPTRMAALARTQERELRSWLYGTEEDRRAGTIRGLLERACDGVERLHGIPVELVVVGGEQPASEAVVELVAAAREAVINAAKHSGAHQVDVYAETTPGSLDVFVRDTGDGFDPDGIPGDRLGIRESVLGRMERIGGTGRVHSAPGEGTEIELHLPLTGGAS